MRFSQLSHIICAVAALLAMAACASIGNPTGGARDEEPPRFVRSNPAPGSVNVDRDRITIDFNEIVNVKDAFTNVIVSPTSKSVPRVTSQGRRVTVNFTDTLAPNTTYTIDFGNSIEDNNESNKLQGFSFSFATGPVLDSLTISGMVLGSHDLEPQQGMLVGIHSDLADSAFVKTRLERIARTDDRGRFTVRGIAPGRYRVFALADADNDYRYANPEEPVAFFDAVIEPWAERVEVSDTVFNLTDGSVDTVVSRTRTRFLPNDLLLRSFTSDRRSQYLSKYERIDSTRVSLIFNAMADSLPQVSLSGQGMPDVSDQSWYVLERSLHNDSLTYWITDPRLISTDSLFMAMRYLRTDSTGNLSLHNDTVRIFTNRPRKPKKEKKKKLSEKDSIAEVRRLITLPMKVSSGQVQEIYDPLRIEFETPLATLDTNAFHLEQKVDTIWRPAGKQWSLSRADSLSPRRFIIEYPWDFDTQYRLTVDTLAATGIYGRVAQPSTHEFKTRAEEEYSAITFNITGIPDSIPAFVELLNASDNPIRAVQVDGGGSVTFRYLQPGKYYARLYEDFNGNGRYDTGDYDSLRQPDMTYYYPKIINIKKNWEKTESWDLFATAVDLQKPEAIKKNKPEADKRRRNNKKAQEEEEEEEEFSNNPFLTPGSSRNDPYGNNRRY